MQPGYQLLQCGPELGSPNVVFAVMFLHLNFCQRYREYFAFALFHCLIYSDLNPFFNYLEIPGDRNLKFTNVHIIFLVRKNAIQVKQLVF